ncbi:MAG: hypothetical protein KGL92_10045 [Gammaproteobacteria bacterium]|nr:hypothetical protein [Gammaproteobacteria bacterium]MDE2348831.1 hypothetical protein [Gammaproteobacteria bacterium]
MKRILLILGALMVAGGLYVLIQAPTYSSQKSVMKIGDFEAKVQQEKRIPPGVGGAVLALGCVLVVVGLAKKA